jgi:hypothetical protein
MLKTIFLSIFTFFVSSLLVANLAWSHPLQHDPSIVAQFFQTNQPAEVTSAADSTDTQKTESSQTSRDSREQAPQDSKRGKPTLSQSDRNQSESGGPYDMEAIKAFNRALYGS